jgi:hypothetical protein
MHYHFRMDDRKNVPDEAKKQTMLFAQLVEILTQNAIMMLGAMPDRQGRQRPPDLNGAEMMIEMLSVLQKKTKGNLTNEEDKMISGTLFQLQTAFAEIASKSGEFGKARKAQEAAEATDEDVPMDDGLETPPPAEAAPRGTSASSSKQQGIQSSAPQTSENKVKFTKKYG